ncbi:hypothetical protein L7P64_RS02170 [Enterobacter hormaechei]|uniref:hypothetical protein n=1 Tax=Enterobacter hormaechei TaxID=158836 RepID=UPI001C5B8FD3|nr:hypothetical protein [Enterobacter hormaechei]MBS6132651.1 hypothetical protein [Enterobacter cloacae]MBW4185863.1 hypothetical protein [Enterobacter hormaechei]MDT7032639.1 hypothetical protein [Enterobacter hormaechei]
MKLSIKHSEVKILLIITAFFFLGMHLVYYATFCLLLASDKLLVLLKRASFRVREFITLFICIVFLIIVYVNGYPNMHIDKSYLPLILLLLTTILFFIVNTESVNVGFSVIQAYIVGMFFKSFITVLYSYINGGEMYGYGMLLDPLSGTIVNSPAYVALLSITFAFCYTSLFSRCSGLSNKTNIFILAISLLLAIYLGGRAFFIIILLTMALNFVAFKSSRKLSFIILLAFIFLAFMIVLFFSQVLQDKMNFLFLRFTNSGLESPRFLLWKDALTKIPNYPFGGFSVDTSLEFTYWYHNLWLDTARLGGWSALGLLVIINIIIALISLIAFKKNSYVKHMFVIQTICLAVMAQEVILEGVLEVIGAYLILGIFLVRLSVKSELKNEKISNNNYLHV